MDTIEKMKSFISESKQIDQDQFTDVLKKHGGKVAANRGSAMMFSFKDGFSATVSVSSGRVKKIEFQKGGRTRNFYAGGSFLKDIEDFFKNPEI